MDEQILNQVFIRYFDEKVDQFRNDLSKELGKEFNVIKSEEMAFMEDKPYTARARLDIKFNREYVAKVFPLLFRPGDGTGNDVLYGNVVELDVTEVIDKVNDVRSALPRVKDCAMEVMFAIGSFINEKFHPGLVSLEEITIDDHENPRKVIKAWDLGEPPEAYKSVIDGKCTIDCGTNEYLTVGYRKDGKRFGDPHAIIHRKDLKATQLVAFLSLYPGDRAGDLLCKKFDDLPSQYSN